MRLSLARRVSAENVPEEMQSAMNNLAVILNPFIEDVTTILNGRVDFDNLSFPIMQFQVMVNASGVPISGDIDLGYIPRGHICINTQDGNNINQLPEITGIPYLLFSQSNSGTAKIAKILNLLPNRKYLLTVLFF